MFILSATGLSHNIGTKLCFTFWLQDCPINFHAYKDLPGTTLKVVMARVHQIGATCKRTADAVVAAGGDVETLEHFVEVVQNGCPGITFHTIADEEILSLTDELQKDTQKIKTFREL
ncbi:hypothetical protein HW555_008123 [Spodoptera exigua]|uniref:Uncharacterized protein n=1 Tax=Spodoptera exigua TaxID=7107 RepID=A0A835GDJ9_SPOEX|nr:hypothetical protein HW555_008123 [Spodoptera exigua]